MQRYVLAESTDLLKTKFFENRYAGSLVALLAVSLLIFSEGITTLDFSKVNGAFVLWPLFGTANQLLAALALIVVSVYLIYRKKYYWYTFAPALLMLALTLYAITRSVINFYQEANWLLFVFALLVLISQILVIISLKNLRQS